VRLIAFHNAFNLNVKFVYGALARLDRADADVERFTLPNGGEPWGDKLSWSNMDAAVQDAAAFISEMGVVRSASSFENYVTGVTAELDRAAARKVATGEFASKSLADTDTSEDDVTASAKGFHALRLPIATRGKFGAYLYLKLRLPATRVAPLAVASAPVPLRRRRASSLFSAPVIASQA